MKEIAIEELRRQLDYNPDTGELTRKVKSARAAIGDKAGYLNQSTGYWMVKVKSQAFKAHRVCWAIYHGYWPTAEIGHINHNKTDNRLVNLREATHLENHKNKRIFKNCTSGVLGVQWNKINLKWDAFIYDNGVRIYLGGYKVFEEAREVRLAAEVKYGYHYNHGKDNK